MIVVVEGVDCAGKTTYCRSLVAMGFEYRHLGRPGPDEDLFDWYGSAILSAGPDRATVFDRAWWSEQVYGPVKRGGSRLLPSDAKLLEMRFALRGGAFVYIDPGLDVVKRRMALRGDTYVCLDELDSLHARYTALAAGDHPAPVLRLGSLWGG